MIWQRRPCEKSGDEKHTRFGAVCGLCNLFNYVCVDENGLVIRQDFCPHNIAQNLTHQTFVFTNDRRSRKK